jgi:hypothetical protein
MVPGEGSVKLRLLLNNAIALYGSEIWSLTLTADGVREDGAEEDISAEGVVTGAR